MKFLLLGDICPTEMNYNLFKKKNIPELFGDAISIFEGNDFIFANLECVLTENGNSIAKFGPALKAPAQTADILRELGVKCIGLSNNHVFDFGVAGIKDTIRELDRCKIDYTGFGDNYEDSRRNYTVEQNGEKICIIAVCEHEYSYALDDRMGSRPYDDYDTMEDIRTAKNTHDRVIVIYHGGKELCRYPSPRLRKLCQAMAKNGADVVLCQHSHCIGAYEEYDGCHILYGQGNFHFIMRDQDECWCTSLAVKYDSKENSIDFIPLKTSDGGIMIAKGEDRDEIINGFEYRNETLQNGLWKQGWHEFCESNREYYTSIVANAFLQDSTDVQNHNFAHYLDCEAHTDVWRELFPTYNHTNEK